jgi:hypothetical protein
MRSLGVAQAPGASSFTRRSPCDRPARHRRFGGRDCSLEPAEVGITEQLADHARRNLFPDLGVELMGACEVKAIIQPEHRSLHPGDNGSRGLEHDDAGEAAIVMAIF